MEALYPFSPAPKCPKCMWVRVSVIYSTRFAAPDQPLQEFLQCKCERCGYYWEMEVAPPPPEPQMHEKLEALRHPWPYRAGWNADGFCQRQAELMREGPPHDPSKFVNPSAVGVEIAMQRSFQRRLDRLAKAAEGEKADASLESDGDK